MSESDKQREDDVNRCREAVNVLMEHFDAVQIFASRCETGSLEGTVNVNQGGGNWFARFGQTKMWVEVETEREIRNKLDSDTD